MTETKRWALQQPPDSTFAWCWLRSPPEEVEQPCGECQIRTVYRESYCRKNTRATPRILV